MMLEVPDVFELLEGKSFAEEMRELAMSKRGHEEYLNNLVPSLKELKDMVYLNALKGETKTGLEVRVLNSWALEDEEALLEAFEKVVKRRIQFTGLTAVDFSLRWLPNTYKTCVMSCIIEC